MKNIMNVIIIIIKAKLEEIVFPKHATNATKDFIKKLLKKSGE